MGKGPEHTLLQGGHTEGTETKEKMLSITCHQRDANQNHNEIPLHASQIGHHKQINKQQVERMWRKGNQPCGKAYLPMMIPRTRVWSPKYTKIHMTPYQEDKQSN